MWHGHGQSNNLPSLNGYGPLANFWAAHGFVVIQPTCLSFKTLSQNPNVDPNGPEGPLFWRSRVEDMKRIIDQLDSIEASVPELSGRLDRSRIAIAGHSLGGHTASILLGARLTDPDDGTEVDLAEPRIKAGVLLATPGAGGAELIAFVAETTDENPERVAAVQRLTWAYLPTALYPEDSIWSAACDALMDSLNLLGGVESK